MSASTQKTLGAKNYEKFLKKLGKRPQSAEALAQKMKLTAGTIRRFAQDGIKLGAVEATKVRNGFHYALKAQPQTTIHVKSKGLHSGPVPKGPEVVAQGVEFVGGEVRLAPKPG